MHKILCENVRCDKKSYKIAFIFFEILSKNECHWKENSIYGWGIGGTYVYSFAGTCLILISYDYLNE